MALEVGVFIDVPNTDSKVILTYNASAGDFIRAWQVEANPALTPGTEACAISIRNGNQEIDSGQLGNYTESETSILYKPIPPIALDAGDVITVRITKREVGTSTQYKAILY